jgi:predicted metal-dependent enzyme (double-stranded beta helix superfamily)
MTQQSAIDQFIESVRGILAEAGVTVASLALVGDKMRALAGTPGLVEERRGEESMHHSEATSTILHTDGRDGLTLMLAKFPESAPTPVHDHNSWGVACVVSGRDRYQHYERLDDGTKPEHAQLRLLYERELSPGDVVVWQSPPQDIHAQQGMGGDAWELVLFGVNAMSMPRRYFDLETGAVREAMPQ